MSGEEVIVMDFVKSLSPVMRLMSAMNIPIPNVTPIMATMVCLGLANKGVFAISKVRYTEVERFGIGYWLRGNGLIHSLFVIGCWSGRSPYLNTSTHQHLNP